MLEEMNKFTTYSGKNSNLRKTRPLIHTGKWSFSNLTEPYILIKYYNIRPTASYFLKMFAIRLDEVPVLYVGNHKEIMHDLLKTNKQEPIPQPNFSSKMGQAFQNFFQMSTQSRFR